MRAQLHKRHAAELKALNESQRAAHDVREQHREIFREQREGPQ